jgi:DNA-directed RNA polymerase subunit M/transcription elongation factor TFIIS
MKRVCPRCGSVLKRSSQQSEKFNFLFLTCPKCGWHRIEKRKIEKLKFSDEEIKKAVEQVKNTIKQRLKEFKKDLS